MMLSRRLQPFSQVKALLPLASDVSHFSILGPVLGKKSSRNKKFDLEAKFLNQREKKKARQYIDIWPSMSIQDIAKLTNKPTGDIIEQVLRMPEANHIYNERQPINDVQLITKIAKFLNYYVQQVKSENQTPKAEVNLDIVVEPPKPEDLEPRPPVVAIMGHIDHGKTTLLDWLRKSRVVEGEFGGITQHIGAFSVQLENSNQKVTFIDTPGHAAFKAMRYRGATATDIVVLVVDVCEGVLDQTLESIRMIKDAQTHMVVALNKIDKPKADVEGTKKQLKEAGVNLEDFGGDVQAVKISALKGTNVSALVDALVAQAEVLQLSADFNGPVEGVVIESTIAKGLGKTATVLVKRGKVKKQQILVSGTCFAKVRLLQNDQGQQVQEAGPSEAVKVFGWRDKVPHSGENVNQVESEHRAHQVVSWREKKEQELKDEIDAIEIAKQREKSQAEYEEYRRMKLRSGLMKPRYGSGVKPTRPKEYDDTGHDRMLSVIVKTDVDGSLEAILNILETYKEDDVVLDIVDFGVGAVTETDVKLAQQFDSVVYAFNTAVRPEQKKQAEDFKVPIKEHNIIYKLIDDVKEELSARLPLLPVDDISGSARVLQEFLINEKRKKVAIAGSKVVDGKIDINNDLKVIRNNVEIYRGRCRSLKHLKDEVTSVDKGSECGIGIDDLDLRLEPGDMIHFFKVRYEKQLTKWDPGF